MFLFKERRKLTLKINKYEMLMLLLDQQIIYIKVSQVRRHDHNYRSPQIERVQ